MMECDVTIIINIITIIAITVVVARRATGAVRMAIIRDAILVCV